MAIKEPRGDRIFGAVVFVIVTLLMLIVLYPLIYVLSCSVSCWGTAACVSMKPSPLVC